MNKFGVLALLVIFQVVGDGWLSRGMRQVGAIDRLNPATLLLLGWQIFTNPWILLGIFFLTAALLLYLAAISRFDLSYVLPMTASSYLLSAVFAWSVLNETVSATRWVGTAIITSGVLLVGLSEEKLNRSRTQPTKRKDFPVLVFFPPSLFLSFSLGLSFAFSRWWIVGTLMVLVNSAGDLLLSTGMKQVGEVSTLHLRSLLRIARRVLLNSYIGLGILCMAIAFFMFITLLSWADFSLVMPITAFTYPASILGTRFFLKEKVNSERLIGASLIAVGIGFISFS